MKEDARTSERDRKIRGEEEERDLEAGEGG